MGGLTYIRLKDTSRNNIAAHNARMKLAKVPMKFRFYSEDNVILEYEAFKIGDGVFPERQFPKDKIKSYQDFKQYWNHEALGEVFCPKFGTLSFDCYFGRTSQRGMRAVAKYIVDNHRDIESTSGSFETFMEKAMTKIERQIIAESNIKINY